MKPNLLNDARRVLTLFAGFVIGMHIAVFLHELGHALGCWLSGGSVKAIIMESPLPAGRVEGSSLDDRSSVWGGVVFGTLISMAPLMTAQCVGRRSPIRFAAMMAAAFCLSHNGMYLFVGSIIPFADASNMIALGAPRWLLFLLGVPLLVGFVFVLTSAIQSVGLRPTESIWKWIIVVELGLWSFLGLMVAAMFFVPVPRSERLPIITFAACYAVCFCIGAYRARRATAKCGSGIESIQMNQSWSVPFALLLSAVVLVVVEWLAFGAAQLRQSHS